MPVFDTDAGKLLFIHVPKTGGTTVLEELRRHHPCSYFDPSLNQKPCSPQHIHGQGLRALFTASDFRHVFMIVRNPVDRLLSEYRYRHQIVSAVPVRIPFRWWLPYSLKRYSRDSYYLDNHFRPQVEFECLEAEVFRLEDGLEQVFERLRSITGADYSAQPEPKHVTRKDPVSLTSAQLDAIRAVYDADFDRYGYDDYKECR